MKKSRRSPVAKTRSAKAGTAKNGGSKTGRPKPAGNASRPAIRVAKAATPRQTAGKTGATKTSLPAGDKRVARREAILEAALDEFSASGFAAARLDDVAKRAGVAKGTIYLYFRDKETLFQELVRAMLQPMIDGIEAMGAADMPARELTGRFVDLFVDEIYGSRRQDVIRLMIAEGRRFPALAEFYYREVLVRILEAVRGLLKNAAAHGDVPPALIEFPQLIAAPGLVAIIWSGLFERFEPLDVRKMMTAHIDLLFAPRRVA